MKEDKNIIKNEIAADTASVGVDLLVSQPFYCDDYITIFNCDSLMAMVAVRPSQKDIIIITDPPYGIGESNERNATRGKLAKTTDFGNYTWDKEPLPDIYIEMMKYISREQIIFGGNYYGEKLGNTKSYIIWDKDNGDNDFADCELAWTSFDKAVRKIKHRWNGMLQQNMKEKEERLHPTQKPLPVMQWIIENYTTPADIIVDPFMGSGTTLAAAKSLGRKAIGMEINKTYCEIAVKRLQAVQCRLAI